MPLEILNKDKLTEGESKFIQKHNSLIKHANDTACHLYLFCKTLNEIKVSKLYKEAGIDSFEAYVIDVLGLKKSQAYNYCTIAEKVSPDIFQLIGKNPSSTKLLVLADLTHEEQLEIVTNIDEKTVNDLKKEVEILRNQNKELTCKVLDYNSKENQIIELETELESLRNNPTIKEIVVHHPDDLKKIDDLEVALIMEKDELHKDKIINKEKFSVLFNVIKNNLIAVNNLLVGFDKEDKERYKNVIRELVKLLG